MVDRCRQSIGIVKVVQIGDGASPSELVPKGRVDPAVVKSASTSRRPGSGDGALSLSPAHSLRHRF